MEFKKNYYTISEVTKLVGVKDYILRYWEEEFPGLKPKKIRGRRLYTPHDIKLILYIKKLLYEEGFTIEGAKKKILHYKEGTEELSLPLNKLDVNFLIEIKSELIKISQILNKIKEK